MEEIKDKAFDDELNKAEEEIGNEKRDNTPLPPHKAKKEKKDGSSQLNY